MPQGNDIVLKCNNNINQGDYFYLDTYILFTVTKTITNDIIVTTAKCMD